MSEFRKAPEGQPTENIELQLSTAEHQLKDWLRHRDEAQKRFDGANHMISHYGQRRDELEWQLEQRKVSQ